MLDERQLNSLDGLWSKGFQIEFHSHSKAILNIDYPTALGELDDVLGSLSIPIESLVRGGGGDASSLIWAGKGIVSKLKS